MDSDRSNERGQPKDAAPQASRRELELEIDSKDAACEDGVALKDGGLSSRCAGLEVDISCR